MGIGTRNRKLKVGSSLFCQQLFKVSVCLVPPVTLANPCTEKRSSLTSCVFLFELENVIRNGGFFLIKLS
jgi:hypothetical protein